MLLDFSTWLEQSVPLWHGKPRLDAWQLCPRLRAPAKALALITQVVRFGQRPGGRMPSRERPGQDQRVLRGGARRL